MALSMFPVVLFLSVIVNPFTDFLYQLAPFRSVIYSASLCMMKNITMLENVITCILVTEK